MGLLGCTAPLVADTQQKSFGQLSEITKPFVTDPLGARPFIRPNTIIQAFHASHLLKPASSSLSNAEGLH